ncbi:MAG: hypothetical protein SH856_13390 [Flavobacteriales bacterium]|nr:hypothetical protein [Flavobacteriales bacterium]
MTNARNIFAIVLSSVVVVIAVFAVLGIWEIIPNDILRHYIWKTVQSIFVLLVCSVIVYIIYAILYKQETPPPGSSNIS